MSLVDSCKIAQTFCNLGKQTVSSIDAIKINNSDYVTTNKIIDEAEWNNLIIKLINIYNYGIRGTRNPINLFELDTTALTGYTTVGHETQPSNIIQDYFSQLYNEKDFIPLELYDKILNNINLTDLDKTFITSEKFNNLLNVINQMSISDDRCDNCNTACNATCQVQSCQTCQGCNSCNTVQCCYTMQQYCCGYD